MATIEKANVFNQLSIAAQIIDGSIKIESTSEFENILQIFPDDPALLRAYGDLLIGLFGSQSGIEEKEDLRKDRIGDRQEIPLKVHLQIHPLSNKEQPLSISGYSKDISIGGMCVVLNSEYRSIASFEDCIKDAGVYRSPCRPKSCRSLSKAP